MASPTRRPSDLGTDDMGRRMFAFDVDATHEPGEGSNPAWYAHLGEHLRNVLELVAGSTFLLGLGASIDEQEGGPLVRVTETPSLPALMTHADRLAYPRSSAQVAVCGRDEKATLELADRAWKACSLTDVELASA